jgi:hypothetical protein
MKKLKTILFMALSLVLVFSSCIDSVNNKLIIGKWKATEWLENDTPNIANATNTAFNFDDKGNYTFSHNETVNKGTYKVENDMLFTTEEGMQEIMVNISKINNDSLVLIMNNSGVKEKLILIKEK